MARPPFCGPHNPTVEAVRHRSVHDRQGKPSREREQSSLRGMETQPTSMTVPDPTERPLTLRLFGPFEAHRDGAPLPRLRSRKGLWLLALLALRQGSEVERDWLAATL